jgi:oligopeptide transport system substrate-binding protein
VNLGAALSLLTLCLASGAGCARRETAVEAGTRAQVLHQSVGADPNDLDPQIISTNQAAAIAMALCEGLTNYDPRDLHAVPGVAESWEISGDGLTYTFHLRANAKWSNGDPVVAEDFVFSARRILSPAFASEFAYMFFSVRGAEDFCLGRTKDFSTVGIRALDARTLRYDLRAPAPYFLTLVAHWSWYPVQPATILKFGRLDEPATAWTRPGNFVGNGPFALAAWRPGDGAIAKRNPHYWDAARVRLAEIYFHFIASADTEERAFRSGQLHITDSVPATKLPGYRAQPASPLRTINIYGTDMIFVNLTRPPLDQPLVRQALSLALDRAAIAAQVLQDGSRPAASLLPPDAHGYTYAGAPRLRFDSVEARRALAAAGYPGGKNFPRLELASYSRDRSRLLAEALQQMWRKELGIEVALVITEPRVHLDNQHRHNFGLSLAGWVGDYLDPLSFLNVYLTASVGHNDSNYRSADYDRLVAEASATAELAPRFALFQQAEALFLRDLPSLPLVHRPSVHLVHRSVRGYEANLMDMHPYTAIWLEN